MSFFKLFTRVDAHNWWIPLRQLNVRIGGSKSSTDLSWTRWHHRPNTAEVVPLVHSPFINRAPYSHAWFCSTSRFLVRSVCDESSTLTVRRGDQINLNRHLQNVNLSANRNWLASVDNEMFKAERSMKTTRFNFTTSKLENIRKYLFKAQFCCSCCLLYNSVSTFTFDC